MYQCFFGVTSFLPKKNQNIFGIIAVYYICRMKKEKAERTGKKQIGLEVTAAEKELAEKVAEARGLGLSALVRLLIKDEARRLGIE